jgi:hypothetical protein
VVTGKGNIAAPQCKKSDEGLSNKEVNFDVLTFSTYVVNLLGKTLPFFLLCQMWG